MQVQYETVVDWDADLRDVGFADADDPDLAGLAVSALKITSGVPASTAKQWLPAALVMNVVTGVLYKMSGTTASPAWSIVDTNTGGLPALTSAHIWVGNGSNIATDVAVSGDLTLANTGAFTIANNAVTTAKINALAVTTAKIADANVTGAKLVTHVGYFSVAKDTNTTTPVNVIAATVPFACTITAVYLISKDTTASNITVTDTAGTVATIAKGTSAGVMVGATSLTNTAVASGDILTIVSSGAGNATVLIEFTTA